MRSRRLRCWMFSKTLLLSPALSSIHIMEEREHARRRADGSVTRVAEEQARQRASAPSPRDAGAGKGLIEGNVTILHQTRYDPLQVRAKTDFLLITLVLLPTFHVSENFGYE